MPLNVYINISIDGQALDLGKVEELPLALNYSLEDPENFQSKKPSTAYNIKVPATLQNDRVANTYHNPSIEDMTAGEVFRGNRPALIEANGQELLKGRAFLVNAQHASLPTAYEFNFYGNNGDWVIDLKDLTFHDIWHDLTFLFTKEVMETSWDFDGTDPLLPYVFMPVRYGDPLGEFQVIDPLTNRLTQIIEDYDMYPEYMRPSLSKYYTMWRAFKTLGYRIQSEFLDLPYFRRQVMPWTWGGFLRSDGTELDNLDFLAKAYGEVTLLDADFTGFLDVQTINDSLNGAFDNNGVYEYDPATFEMKWTYLPTFNYGTLVATFHFAAFVSAVATANSDVELRIQWFKNGVKFDHGPDNGNGTELLVLNAPAVGRREQSLEVEDFASIEVNPGDVISAKIYAHTFDSRAGIARLHVTVDAFELDYFRIPLGGTINFANYTGLKKWKFLDFLAGVVDEFNLCIQTDPIDKVIYIEPMHPYSLTNDMSAKAGGYFNGDWLDWEEKHDLSQQSEIILYSDTDREMRFAYKDDANDGALKTIQDRNVNRLAMAKYVFPDRFKVNPSDDKTKPTHENRFFAPQMHMEFVAWKGLSADANYVPQIPVLMPENISNASRDEAQNTFEPKSVYYEGADNTIGWIWDGVVTLGFPQGYAVLYKPGGENKPILSYADEVILYNTDGTPNTIGKGLMRRFFLQRLEIMRNGQFYTTFFKLNNNDISNFLHREHIICRGERWELVEIRGYQPLKEQSTECFLRRFSPVRNISNG